VLELPSQEWSAYRRRILDERNAGWITPKHWQVLCAIADLNEAGDWEPTVAKIAVNSGVDPRTVRRARLRAQGRGLLMVQAQFEIVDGRRQQRANHYEIRLPTAPCQPKLRISRGGQPDRPREIQVLSKMLTKAPRGVDLLAMRRKAFEQQQIAALAARRLM
jgi:hypothetical protein